jgi:SpoIID/LytB domain protein
MQDHKQLFREQSKSWTLAADNYRALSKVLIKEFLIDDLRIRLQFNPGRIISSSANISKDAIKARPCFLCEKNRPTDQKALIFEDGENQHSDTQFQILVNPFPVFPRHFTIAAMKHQPQAIHGQFETMLRLAKSMNDCVIFYNGPRCGASAPDHLHFQAGSKGLMPIESDFEDWKKINLSPLYENKDLRIFKMEGFLRNGWLMEGKNRTECVQKLEQLLNSIQPKMEEEPMLNLLCWYQNENWICAVFPRQAHRPRCYFRKGQSKLLISPASVEMGGLMIAARQEDFERIDEKDIREIYNDVSISKAEIDLFSNEFLKNQDIQNEPVLEVGIVSGIELSFCFPHPYLLIENKKTFCGTYSASLKNGKIRLENQDYSVLEFEPVVKEGAAFELFNVRIGIDFHWERTEKQAFEGNLKCMVEDDKITAINRIPLESYLTSVISSEMSAKASAELLKAHAVISRSWLLSQMRQKGKNKTKKPGFIENETERIRWYDREDHTNFDVCADDHCQRYQGITRASTTQVREAIKATRGQVLTSGAEICDARFSKCCGGMMEEFQFCWEDSPKPYLVGLADKDTDTFATPDLRKEENAKAWILGNPPAFCNTSDKTVLQQVLNNYDQETADFYRWKISYTIEKISKLVYDRSGIDFGEIQELIPLERGVSGRIVKLKIVGSKKNLIIGKELEIRRTLSTSHLYSSAFVVDKTADGFMLTGAGWGHGVGLCQIGAAMMGEKGYDYSQILTHYYPNTLLKKLYK